MYTPHQVLSTCCSLCVYVKCNILLLIECVPGIHKVYIGKIKRISDVRTIRTSNYNFTESLTMYVRDVIVYVFVVAGCTLLRGC